MMPPLWSIDEGAVIVDEEFAPLYGYIQDAIQEKKKKCMSLNKSGPRKVQRKDDYRNMTYCGDISMTR